MNLRQLALDAFTAACIVMAAGILIAAVAWGAV